MLQAFSDRIRNSRWLGYLIVGLISIPFALWGIQSYIGGPSASSAAEVNGETIPLQQVQRMAAQQRQQLRAQFGGSLPEELGDRVFMERALSEAINRELMRQVTTDGGYRVTDEILRRSIQQQSMFQRDGQFDRELYRELLSRSGLSPRQYEADVRVGYAIQQLQRGLASSAFVLDREARTVARMMREERNVALLVHPRAAIESSVAVDEPDVRRYYEENLERFERPAQVRVDYVELSMEALISQIEVSEEDLRAEYRGNEARYKGQEERKAAHILLEIGEQSGASAEEEALRKARQLRDRIREGADFAEIARDHSDDPGSAEQGGSLGYVSRGTMVDAFEKALFSLDEKGAVSKPIRSPYGYHLIKLLDVRKGDSRSFEEVRNEIEDDLRKRRAERLFYDRVEVLRNNAYEQPGSLRPAADATGLPIEGSEWFSRQSGSGIASSEKVRAAAFSPDVHKEGLNSDLVELGPRRVVVFRMSNERPAEPRPFAEVRDQARRELREERVEQALADWADDMESRLDEGATPGTLATGPVELRRPGWIARDQEGTGIDASIQQTAFSLPAPATDPVHGAVTMASGDRAVVIVEASRLPEIGQESVAAVADQQRQQQISGEIQTFLAALREAAEITRNEDNLGAR